MDDVETQIGHYLTTPSRRHVAIIQYLETLSSNTLTKFLFWLKKEVLLPHTRG